MKKKEYIPYIPKDCGVTIDFKLQKTCKHKKRVVINRNLMFGDGDVVCESCGKFIRTFDSG